MMIPRKSNLLSDLLKELDNLRSQGTAVDKLSRQLRCYEAAMRLIERHELWVEFAEEIKAIEASAITSAYRKGEE